MPCGICAKQNYYNRMKTDTQKSAMIEQMMGGKSYGNISDW